MTSRASIFMRFTLLAAALLLLPAHLAAQGWVEPRPGNNQQWGIEKVRTSVTVRVKDRVAQVEVEEWFRNNGGGLGEGDYVYPLPGEAIFSSYSLYQGEQELRGEMLDAVRARDVYETIVRSKKDPALIELVGKGMLRARVFPIEPGQTRRITLRYTQVLERAGEALQFRYAAGGRNVGSRPMDITPMIRPAPMPGGRPSMPLEMPAAMRAHEPAPLTFSLIVEDATQFRDAFSPTHSLRVDRHDSRMTVRMRDELSGDLAVFLPFATRAVGVTLASHRPAGEDGYFMLTLSPGEVAESRVPRDVTVVVDVSGSMSGEKMEQAQRALHQLLGTLGTEDRLRLISFSSGVKRWREGWTRATREELRDARRWTDDLRAEGGTNIHDALKVAFSETSPESRLPIVVFMTDGLPTNGESRPDRIVAMAEAERGRARVFAFGVGYDVNTYLLDRLSAAARGTTQYVRPNEDVEAAVAVLAAKVRHPVLTDLALVHANARITEVYPRDMPDLFAGEELLLFGRYQGTGNVSLSISGRRNQQTERYQTTAHFAARDEKNDYIARLWASRKLGDLDRRIRSAQADGASPRQVEGMIAELRQTALRYGLLSEYTSYLVLEPGMVVANRAAFDQLGRVQASAAPTAPPPPVAQSGQAAVARAEEARQQREVTSLADVAMQQKLAASRASGSGMGAQVGNAAAQQSTQMIAGRTFVQRNGAWEDARHSDKQRVVSVEPYSPAYFALLRALPELSYVLRELDTVTVAGERVSVRIAAGGVRTQTNAELTRTVAEFRTKQ